MCPKCLLLLGLGNQRERQAGSESENSSTSPSRIHVPDPQEIAESFPQLEIVELVGSGGMGAVYKARQRELDRWVAVKILLADGPQDPEFAERFTREAQALARLSHPNIVAVHDFGQTDGLYYFVMEFVDGTSLRHVIASGGLQPDEALAIVPQICEALQYAHDQGIVHRDIKPENVLLDKTGQVKVADFGLAKLMGRSPEEFTLTDTNRTMGTPCYMAPEQLERPLEVDHRADVYSLGVVLYEMLTGELPLGRFASPSAKVQVDVRLDQVVLRALEKDPERRYQQVSELKTVVETVATGPGARPSEAAPDGDTVGEKQPSQEGETPIPGVDQPEEQTPTNQVHLAKNRNSIATREKQSYTLRGLLLLMGTIGVLVFAAGILGLWRSAGPVELALLVVGTPCVVGGAMLRWPRCLRIISGLLVGALLMAALEVLFSVWGVSGVWQSVGPIELSLLLVLGMPCVLVGALLGWPQCVGVIACLFFGVFLSPPDPASMLILAVPLSFVYWIRVIAWSASRSQQAGTTIIGGERKTTMSTKIQAAAAVALIAVSSCLLGGLFYLVKVVPEFESEWYEANVTQPAAAEVAVNLSHFSRVYGLIFLPFLLLGISGGIVWLVLSLRKRRVAPPERRATGHKMEESNTTNVQTIVQGNRTSGLAITSLILSCLTIVIGPFGCVPGIVCGHLARAECRKDPAVAGAGMATAGLIVGYVLLAFGLLVAFVIFALAGTPSPSVPMP